jgi:hypothetical protein
MYRPGVGAGAHRCFLGTEELREDTWVRGIRAIASDMRGVRQVDVYALQDTDAVRKALAFDAQDPTDGYPCFIDPRIDEARHLASWSVGTPHTIIAPEGMGILVKKQSRLVVSAHFSVTSEVGAAFETSLQIGLMQSKGAARELVPLRVRFDGTLSAGARDGVIGGAVNLPPRHRIRALTPRMHGWARFMQLMSAGGQCLATFDHWSPWDIRTYVSQNPVTTAETPYQLSCRYRRPAETVTTGNTVDDEACELHLLLESL